MEHRDSNRGNWCFQCLQTQYTCRACSHCCFVSETVTAVTDASNVSRHNTLAGPVVTVAWLVRVWELPYWDIVCATCPWCLIKGRSKAERGHTLQLLLWYSVHAELVPLTEACYYLVVYSRVHRSIYLQGGTFGWLVKACLPLNLGC